MAVDDITFQAFKALRALGMRPIDIQRQKCMIESYVDAGVSYEDMIQAMARHGTVRPTGRGIIVDLSVVNAGAATYAGGDVDAHLATVAEQMNEGYHPANDTKAQPVGSRTAWYKAVAAGVMIGAAIFGASGAYAVPIMGVTASQSIDDYAPGNPGNESIWQYTIANQSEPGSINNMIEFTLPAGSDDGIFYIQPPTGWTPTIDTDETVFLFASALLPGQVANLDVYAYPTTYDFGNASAVAAGGGPGFEIPFNEVSVGVPRAQQTENIPEPGSIALLALGLGALMHRKYRENRETS